MRKEREEGSNRMRVETDATRQITRAKDTIGGQRVTRPGHIIPYPQQRLSEWKRRREKRQKRREYTETDRCRQKLA